MLRTVLLFLVMSLCLVLTAQAEDQAHHLQKKNSFAFKPGYHFYPDSDFLDYWHINREDMSGFMFEAAYERALQDILSLEFGFGYFRSSTSWNNMRQTEFSSDLKLYNWYFSPALKAKLHITDLLYLYCGAGPNLYLSKANFKYHSEQYELTKKRNEYELSLGGHVLAGIEFYILPQPGPDSYDWPLGLFLEYRHSWVQVKDLDQELVQDINQAAGTNLHSNDLDVGGGQLMLGLRWHF